MSGEVDVEKAYFLEWIRDIVYGTDEQKRRACSAAHWYCISPIGQWWTPPVNGEAK